MGRFRKVEVRIWRDAKFRKLSDEAKLLWFRLLTDPELTSFGALAKPLSGLAEDMGWTPKQVSIRVSELVSNLMLKLSLNNGLLVIWNYVKYNPPANEKQIKGWNALAKELPECDLLSEYLTHIKEIVEEQNKSKNIPVSIPFDFGIDTRMDTRMDTRIEHGDGDGDGDGDGKERKKEIKANSGLANIKHDLIETWNGIDGFPKILRFSKKRTDALSARLKDGHWRENWKAALAKAAKLGCLHGDNDRNWVADIDWFLRPDTVLKIIEGKYDSWSSTKKTAGWDEIDFSHGADDTKRQAEETF